MRKAWIIGIFIILLGSTLGVFAQGGFTQKDRNLLIELKVKVSKMEKRFNERFESLAKRMDRFMIWSFALTISATGLILGFMRVWIN